MPKGIYVRKTRSVVTVIGPSIAYVPLTQNQYALIDAEYASEIGKHKWYAHRNKVRNTFYAMRNSGDRRVRMHAAILNPSHGLLTDHISTNGLDNRRANLREATNAQNKHNCCIHANNTSGFKGVSWHEATGKWVARVGFGGKRKNYGYFKTPKEAYDSIRLVRIELHGEFARTA